MKTKIFSLLAILILSFTFTSCIEITESISINKGNYEISFRCLFNNTVLGLLGVEPSKIVNSMEDELFDDDDFKKIENFKTHQTELETGFSFDIKTSIKNPDPDFKEIVPIISKNTMIFPLTTDDFDSDDLDIDEDEKALTAAMLVSAKYRLLLNKKDFPNVKSVQLINAKTNQKVEDIEIQFYDDGVAYTIEIPIYSLSTEKNLNLKVDL